MKKLLVVVAFSGSMLFAGKEQVVTKVVDSVKKSAVVVTPEQKTALYSKAVTAIKSLVAQGKAHYLIAGSAVTVAGLVALYYTNAEFKKAVHAWLGLEEAAVQK